MKRRDFLRTAGRLSGGAAVVSVPFIGGCKGTTTADTPLPPEEPVAVNLEFRVYNHTQGLKATFFRDHVISGTTLPITISDILAQNSVSGVDPQRIALRKENFGVLIEYSNLGTVNLEVPRIDSKFDIYLFNSRPDDLYLQLEGQPCTGWNPSFKSCNINVFRKDFDGQTGDERIWGGEPVAEIGGCPGVFDQINDALRPSWAPFKYGSFTRTSIGEFSYGFGESNANLFWNSEFNTTINAEIVQTVPEQIAMGLAAVFQRTMGWYGVGMGDAFRWIQSNGVLHPAGKDVWAFMYVRSPRARNA